MRCIYQSHGVQCCGFQLERFQFGSTHKGSFQITSQVTSPICSALPAWPRAWSIWCACRHQTPSPPNPSLGFPMVGLQVRSNHISPKNSDQVSVPHMFSIVFPTFFGEFSEFSSSPGHLSPQDFTLRLSGCCTLRRFGCAASLPRTLRRLELGLDSCERLQDATELLRGIGPLDAKHGGEHAVKQWLESVGMGYSFKETKAFGGVMFVYIH